MTVKTSRLSQLGALQDLLIEACPPEGGRRSIPILAEKLELSSATIYKWLHAGRIPGRRIKQIIALWQGGECPVTIEDFLPFAL